MNMEDRLREAFDQEANHLHAPSGSPETAVRRGRRRRASNLIGGATLILALVGGTAAGVQLLGDTEDPPARDLTADLSTETVQRGTDLTSSESSLPAAGVVDFAWERITLPKPDGSTAWSPQVVAVDGGFIAVAHGIDETSDRNQLITWTSSNGTDWSWTATDLGGDQSIDEVLNTGDGFVVVGRPFNGLGEAISLYSSTDGITWNKGEVNFGPLEDNQYVSFSGATASGNGTTVVGAILQTQPPEPPVVLEAAGVVLEQNSRDGTYTVSDLDTGEVITVIEGEAIYGGSPAIYGADGELLLALPFEVFEERLGQGSAAFEQDGILVEFDGEDFTFVATDVASGKVVASGSQGDLYRSPRLQIADESGNLIVDIDMDEFYRAQERSYSDSPEYFSTSTSSVLVTSDGTTWTRHEITGASALGDSSISGIAYGPDGFVLSVNTYGPEQPTREVWASTDGRDWEVVSTANDFRDGPMVSRDGAFFSTSYDRRPGISSSTDGVNWTPVYEAEGGEYYNSIQAGELGLVAIGQIDDAAVGPPFSVSKDGRTMTLDYAGGRLTVTDDATADVLRVIEFDIYAEDPPAGIEVDEGDSGFTILDTDGTPLMVLTEDDMSAASGSEGSGDFTLPVPAVLYSPDGEKWFKATTAGLDVAWPQSVAVGKDVVLIAGDSSDQYYSDVASGSDGSVSQTLTTEDGVTTSYATATTVAAGGFVSSSYVGNDSYVWVGRLR